MRLSELKAITKRMREIGLSPETTTVNDIWGIVRKFRGGQIC